MNFDTIDKSIPQNEQNCAQKNFQGLTLELGVRDDNQHVGSGLGGNGSQLFALMSFSHELVSDPSITIQIDRGLMRWGVEWFNRATRKEMRYELDAKLPIAKATPLDDIRKDTRFSLGPNVSNWDTLFFACNMCAALASDLDSGKKDKVRPTALALSGFPMETTLVAVRQYIQIDRLVKYDLDEHPDFSKVLTTINKAID